MYWRQDGPQGQLPPAAFEMLAAAAALNEVEEEGGVGPVECISLALRRGASGTRAFASQDQAVSTSSNGRTYAHHRKESTIHRALHLPAVQAVLSGFGDGSASTGDAMNGRRSEMDPVAERRGSETERDNAGRVRPEFVPDPKRWLVLAVVVLATLMVVLDASIVTIAASPSAQRSLLYLGGQQAVGHHRLHAVAFGGLLLLGGRIADFGGRRRMFILGLVGFAAASRRAWRQLLSINGCSSVPLARCRVPLPCARHGPRGPVDLDHPRFSHDAGERAKAFGAYGAVFGRRRRDQGAVGRRPHRSTHRGGGASLSTFRSPCWQRSRQSESSANLEQAAQPSYTTSRGAVLVYGRAGQPGLGFTKAVTDGWSSTPTPDVGRGGSFHPSSLCLSSSKLVPPIRCCRCESSWNETGAAPTWRRRCWSRWVIFAMFIFISYYFHDDSWLFRGQSWRRLPSVRHRRDQ